MKKIFLGLIIFTALKCIGQDSLTRVDKFNEYALFGGQWKKFSDKVYDSVRNAPNGWNEWPKYYKIIDDAFMQMNWSVTNAEKHQKSKLKSEQLMPGWATTAVTREVTIPGKDSSVVTKTTYKPCHPPCGCKSSSFSNKKDTNIIIVSLSHEILKDSIWIGSKSDINIRGSDTGQKRCNCKDNIHINTYHKDCNCRSWIPCWLYCFKYWLFAILNILTSRRFAQFI